ncbi:hypothetical protein F0562_007391 [Nyssa sinensis]|uniref:Uncharacterized protein n=1 Tax=Nyssa sinensis TaxID=561372 RepID=A0A5J5A6H5_9ASTE|nr:hypothetical protein F0562_007391 [Nyssa sinensis]
MDSKPTLGAKEEALNSHFSNGFVEPGNCESVGITNVEVDGLSSSDDAFAARENGRFREAVFVAVAAAVTGLDGFSWVLLQQDAGYRF